MGTAADGVETLRTGLVEPTMALASTSMTGSAGGFAGPLRAPEAPPDQRRVEPLPYGRPLRQRLAQHLAAAGDVNERAHLGQGSATLLARPRHLRVEDVPARLGVRLQAMREGGHTRQCSALRSCTSAHAPRPRPSVCAPVPARCPCRPWPGSARTARHTAHHYGVAAYASVPAPGPGVSTLLSGVGSGAPPVLRVRSEL